ncbi:hypothetical protein EAF00_003902 [Botryotinia globosa]|nr:hypothetical protein EAF00_003902 [Botryotinia globosa]
MEPGQEVKRFKGQEFGLVERHLSLLKLNSSHSISGIKIPIAQVEFKLLLTYIEAFQVAMIYTKLLIPESKWDIQSVANIEFSTLRDALLDFSGDSVEQIQKRDRELTGFTACSTTSTSTALTTDLPKFPKTSVSAASTSTPRFSKSATSLIPIKRLPRALIEIYQKYLQEIRNATATVKNTGPSLLSARDDELMISEF